MAALTGIFESLVAGVRAVNQKYAVPQIEMTPFVKTSLLTLRLYLFLLVGLLLYKFILTVHG
jgi:hypothetical protein